MSIKSASTSTVSNASLRTPISRSVRVLTVAGGGGGGASGTRPCGGGGGGGMIDDTIIITRGTSYTVIIGAGGAIQAVGSYSRFGPFFAIGGGPGTNGSAVGPGATSGGSHASTVPVPVLAGPQGTTGGRGSLANYGGGGGGGGASGTTGGGTGTAGTTGGNGGNGTSSTVPVNSTSYSGGGGGGGTVGGSGGTGSGGNGSSSGTTTNATAGGPNTGGGGGGGGTSATLLGAAGGSGIIIFRFNSALKCSVSVGLTQGASSPETSGSDTIITITAGTGTVTFS